MRTFGIIVAVLLLLALLAALALWAWLRDRGVAGGERKKAPEGAEWQAEVELEKLTEWRPTFEALRLKVVLRDSRGREVETPDVRFQLDGVDLEYRVSRGNYYDRHPYYKLDEESRLPLTNGSPYRLSISSGGGPFKPFAEIPALADLSAQDFSFPTRHARNRDLVITWRNVRQSAELLIYKSHTSKDEQGDVFIEGGPYSHDSLRARIEPGRKPDSEGRYIIPSRYLVASPPSKVHRVTVEITAKSAGQFLYPVFEKSHVTTVRKIVLRTDIEDP